MTVLSKSRSAVTWTVELPGPRTRSSSAWTWLAFWFWKSLTYWLRELAAAPPIASVVESSLPLESATVTFSGSMPSMLAATRCTTDWTCSGPRVSPGRVPTSTEAVGGSCLSAKTCLAGMARCTTADCTPSIASMVLVSSPSMARLKSVCSLNCEVERSCSSRSE